MTFSLIILVVGTLGIVLGAVVRRYKMGSVVSNVDLKKYDNDKVSDIAGSYLIVQGILLIALAAINYILKYEYEYIVLVIFMIILTLINLGMSYKIKKYAKLNN